MSAKLYEIGEYFEEFNEWHFRECLSDDEQIKYDRTGLAMLIREKKEEKDLAEATGSARIRLMIQMMNERSTDE